MIKAFAEILKLAQEKGLVVNGNLASNVKPEILLQFLKDAIDVMVRNGMTLNDIKDLIDFVVLVTNLRSIR
jgi:hypothetical protein